MCLKQWWHSWVFGIDWNVLLVRNQILLFLWTYSGPFWQQTSANLKNREFGEYWFLRLMYWCMITPILVLYLLWYLRYIEAKYIQVMMLVLWVAHAPLYRWSQWKHIYAKVTCISSSSGAFWLFSDLTFRIISTISESLSIPLYREKMKTSH